MQIENEGSDFASLSKRYAYLVTRYARKVKRRCHNFEVDDITQELWLVFEKVRQSFDAKQGHFEHMLARSLHNAAFNLVRTSIRRYPATGMLVEDLPTYTAPDARLHFQDALTMLNPRQRALATALVTGDRELQEREWRRKLRAKRVGATHAKRKATRHVHSKDLGAIREALRGRVVKENEKHWLKHLRTAKIRAVA